MVKKLFGDLLSVENDDVFANIRSIMNRFRKSVII